MHSGIRTALIVTAVATALSTGARAAASNFKLTFDKPATKWTEAVPLGNGRIGAMVFGGTEDERLQINESTLWGVGPHDYTNPDAYSHLDEIRQPIFAGKVDEAEKLSENLMGKPKLLMPYQPFCDLHLHLPGHGQATEYRRELHIDDAIAETVYKVGSVTFRREVFCEPRHVAEFSVGRLIHPLGRAVGRRVRDQPCLKALPLSKWRPGVMIWEVARPVHVQ